MTRLVKTAPAGAAQSGHEEKLRHNGAIPDPAHTAPVVARRALGQHVELHAVSPAIDQHEAAVAGLGGRRERDLEARGRGTWVRSPPRPRPSPQVPSPRITRVSREVALV